jgi:hypothetical protein
MRSFLDGKLMTASETKAVLLSIQSLFYGIRTVHKVISAFLARKDVKTWLPMIPQDWRKSSIT